MTTTTHQTAMGATTTADVSTEAPPIRPAESFQMATMTDHVHIAVTVKDLSDGQNESYLNFVQAEICNFFAAKVGFWREMATAPAPAPAPRPTKTAAMSVATSELAYLLARKAGALMRGDFKEFRGRMPFWGDAHDAYTALYGRLERQLGAFMPVNIPDPDDLLGIEMARTEIVWPFAIKVSACPSCDYTHFCAIEVIDREDVISVVIRCESCELDRMVTLKMGVMNE